jgi:microcystin-dependent protein
MSTPYIGEIRLFAGTFAPVGWAFCQGQLMSIAENEVLYALIGTTYGGDGQQTFAMPDLRGRVPVHTSGQGGGLSLRVMGEKGGAESITLQAAHLPGHTHAVAASTAAASAAAGPAGNLLATGSVNRFGTGSASAAMAQTGSVGGNQPKSNMPDYIAVNYIISLFGVFPSQA